MTSKLDEMLAARQAPGILVRTPVRSVALRDGAGRTTRVLYGGEENVERDVTELAARDGLDLRTTKMVEIESECGQGIGRRGDKRSPSQFRRPQKRSKGRALTEQEREEQPVARG